MPLPTPNKDEQRDEFISRCIEDAKTEQEFPNLSQRIAVCVSQYDNKDDEPQNDVKVRKNADCPDGWEHQMPDGSYMCGKTHGGRKKKKSPYNNETYNDYPQAATNNAKRALKWVDENGWGSCGEQTGKNRANQLANREPISRDTIARMASFKRHQQHKDVPYSEGCGGLMWDAWGGTSGVEWAIRKLEQIDAKNEIYYDHTYHFTKDEMNELHENGVLYVTQTDEDGTEMVIKFTY